VFGCLSIHLSQNYLQTPTVSVSGEREQVILVDGNGNVVANSDHAPLGFFVYLQSEFIGNHYYFCPVK
jgi:hypothetical protein